ncbi:hypothetical protein KKG31_00660 [Patescibacteria group bacterium]|nr:hypothetical protein [Patescibacteria group bacterium]MBU1757696.1 hypothetical protein [Patescibacteria group bacterium]
MIRGNASSIRFFVGVPKRFRQFFQNTFYSNYPTSDLIELKDLPIAKNREHIKFKNTAKIADQSAFTRDGTYMDPMNDMLSLYNTIDANSNLDLYFTYTFKKRKNINDYAL